MKTSQTAVGIWLECAMNLVQYMHNVTLFCTCAITLDYGLQHSGQKRIIPYCNLRTCHCDVCWGGVHCILEDSTNSYTTRNGVAVSLSHDAPQEEL